MSLNAGWLPQARSEPVEAAPSTKELKTHRTSAFAAIAYFAALLFAYAAIILVTPRAPVLQDYPTWVYEGVAVAHVLKGQPDPQFTLKHFPVPNMLSDVGLGLLCTIMDWRLAAKLWLCFYLALSGFACRQLVRSLPKPSPYAYWIAPTIAVVNLCFWWGFINFQFSVVLMLLFCSALLRPKPRAASLASLLALVFFSHAIAFGVCGFALLVRSWISKSYRLFAATLPSALLLAWYVYGRFVSIGNPEQLILHDTPVPYMTRAFVLYKINTFFKSLGYVNPSLNQVPVAYRLFGPAWMCVLVLVAAVLGIALVYLLIVSARQSLKTRAADRFLWIVFAFAIVAAMLAPSEALGISDPGARFMVCALSLGVMLIKPASSIGKLASLLSVILGLAGAAMFLALSLRPAGVTKASIQPSYPRYLPRAVVEFAHVAPDSRAYYYEPLSRGVMGKPVFDSSLLFNTPVHRSIGRAPRTR